MTNELAPLTVAEFGFISLYLLALILVGLAGWYSRKSDSLKDFYLGGRSTGILVLLLTLYATQYSGNTLFGFTGKTYRVGFTWAVSIQFMTAIVVVYLLFAPRLYALSRKFGFVTPADYLNHRFASPLLSLVASLVMIVAIANFLLAQMMAMGKAVEGLFIDHPLLAYCSGVILLAGIIVLYETLGGFRAVAWTDAIQGSILLFGFTAFLFVLFQQFGTLEQATNRLAEQAPEKLRAPSGPAIREWISYLLIVGLGGAMYPQAVQRIYCARNARTLRISLMIMVFLPLTTTMVSLIAGVMGLAHLPNLEPGQTDSLLTLLCREVQQHSLLGRWIVVVLLSAILAAIMSTADSILLTLSSMLTKDVYGPWVSGGQAGEQELMKVGKWFSWIFISLAAIGAILLKDTTLVKLIDRKLDLLVQLAPAFLLGVWWSRLRGDAVLGGLVVGVLVAVTMAVCGYGKWLGIHAGLFGLVANLLVSVVGSLLFPAGIQTKDPAAKSVDRMA